MCSRFNWTLIHSFAHSRADFVCFVCHLLPSSAVVSQCVCLFVCLSHCFINGTLWLTAWSRLSSRCDRDSVTKLTLVVIEGSEGDERESDRARETVRELSSATLQETASRACINILELLLRDVNATETTSFCRISSVECGLKKIHTETRKKYYK